LKLNRNFVFVQGLTEVRELNVEIKTEERQRILVDEAVSSCVWEVPSSKTQDCKYMNTENVNGYCTRRCQVSTVLHIPKISYYNNEQNAAPLHLQYDQRSNFRNTKRESMKFES
jgi:hypothetical protein